MKEQVKEWRLRIELLRQLTKDLKYIAVSTEGNDAEITISEQLNDVEKSLYLSREWLGEVLKTMNEELTIDKYEIFKLYENLNYFRLDHIEKVNYIKSEIQIILDEINSSELMLGASIGIYQINIITHLSEARFHLGFELERIKNEN